MDHLPPPPRPQWRRIQLARYFIDYRDHRLERMRFDAHGTLTDFGLPQEEIDAVIDAGTAFRTSGCPGKEACTTSPRATGPTAICRRAASPPIRSS